MDNETITQLTEEDLKKQAKKELLAIDKLEDKKVELELALAKNPQFVQFLKIQKQVADKADEFKKSLEKQMIDSGVKTIDITDWGKITVVERTDVKVVNITKLPKKFINITLTPPQIAEIEKLIGKELPGEKTVNQGLLTSTVQLTDKLPAGVEKKVSHYIRMTPKKVKEIK